MDEKEHAKQFLRFHLINHPIWRHMIIWEKALFKTLRDELRMNSPVKTFTSEEVTQYEEDVMFAKMSSLLTDYLYFGMDKEALSSMFSSFGHSQRLPEDRIELLNKKIFNFGNQTVEPVRAVID